MIARSLRSAVLIPILASASLAYPAEEIKSLFKFKDEGEPESRLKPVYKAKTGSKKIQFPEILFTRVAADLAEKIYLALDQEKALLIGLNEPSPGTSVAPRAGR